MYRVLVVDMDGVVWRGNRYIEENIRGLKALMEKGLRVYFLTNNTTKTRREYVERLRRAGLDVDLGHVFNSSYGAALYIRGRGGGSAYVIGEQALVAELASMGIDIASMDRDRVDYVVVGLDRYLTYNKLSRGMRYVLDGALFVATNKDVTLPVGDSVEPGAGSIVAALETALGRAADVVIGKPNTYMLDVILGREGVGKEEVLVIGDRLDTDVLFGARAGVDTLLVLTGIATRRDVEESPVKPKYVAENILSFVERFYR